MFISNEIFNQCRKRKHLWSNETGLWYHYCRDLKNDMDHREGDIRMSGFRSNLPEKSFLGMLVSEYNSSFILNKLLRVRVRRNPELTVDFVFSGSWESEPSTPRWKVKNDSGWSSPIAINNCSENSDTLLVGICTWFHKIVQEEQSSVNLVVDFYTIQYIY